MNQEKKPSKRKIVLRYVLLAVCILLIAVATLITVLATNNWFRRDLSLDVSQTQPDDKPDDGNEGDKPDDGNEGDKPTLSDTDWITPVTDVNVINSYDFIMDVSLRNCWHMHEGIDFSASVGTPVMCAFDGTVEKIVLDNRLDGNTVTIRHADGVKTVYSYIEIDKNLKVGDAVKRGDKLGTVAPSTGAECNLEPHLHFAVIKNGKCADPETFLEISPK